MARSLLVLIVGAWFGILVASWGVASVNFRTAERVAGADGEVGARLAPVAPADRRFLFRHMAGEINRWMFRTWGPAQIVLGLAALALAWPLGGATRIAVLVAFVLCLAQLAVSSAIADLGRTLDFVARPLPPDVARRFGALHGAYVVADLLKAAVLAAAAVLLVRSR